MPGRSGPRADRRQFQREIVFDLVDDAPVIFGGLRDTLIAPLLRGVDLGADVIDVIHLFFLFGLAARARWLRLRFGLRVRRFVDIARIAWDRFFGLVIRFFRFGAD